MKKFLLIALSVLMMLSASCGTQPTPPEGETSTSTSEPTSTYRTISPAGVNALLNNGKDIVLLDVRRADEYAEKHIPSAILLPNEDIGDARPEQLPDLDATIIIYCRSGNRSKEAAEKLIALGYTDVRDLGGINDWSYATVSGAEVGVWTAEEVEPGVLTEFTATDLDGRVVDESSLSDHRLTMVNIWATFCGPCINEMPDLGKLAVEYESQGVQIVGLVSDVLDSNGALDPNQVSLAKDIVAQTGANYLHILPSEDLLGILYQATSVPMTFFVDANGRQVGYAYVGSRSKDDWKAIIDETLKEVAE